MSKSRSYPSRAGPAFAAFVFLVVLALAIPAPAMGQVQFDVQLNLPAVLPPLVQVRPGVRVIRDLDEEIFYVNGRYWLRRDDRWYSARNPRGRWVQVAPRRAPVALTQMPQGLFRHWQGRPANLPSRLPPLVTIRPGVRVVRDFDEEVFYARGYYWVRRDGHWFRARNHQRNWAYVEPGRAPREIAQFQPGQYRRWRGDENDRQRQRRNDPQQGPRGRDDDGRDRR